MKSVVRVKCDVGYLCANFSLPRPLCSGLGPNVRDRQTSDAHHRLMPPTLRAGHNNRFTMHSTSVNARLSFLVLSLRPSVYSPLHFMPINRSLGVIEEPADHVTAGQPARDITPLEAGRAARGQRSVSVRLGKEKQAPVWEIRHRTCCFDRSLISPSPRQPVSMASPLPPTPALQYSPPESPEGRQTRGNTNQTSPPPCRRADDCAAS